MNRHLAGLGSSGSSGSENQSNDLVPGSSAPKGAGRTGTRTKSKAGTESRNQVSRNQVEARHKDTEADHSDQPELNACKAAPEQVHVRGGSSDAARASWCTPKWLAEAVGAFDLDPFSNPRSHIAAHASCALERGLVCVLRRAPDGRPFGFEPPPGVVASSNSFPHALFYRYEADVTAAVLAHAIAWRKQPT